LNLIFNLSESGCPGFTGFTGFLSESGCPGFKDLQDFL